MLVEIRFPTLLHAQEPGLAVDTMVLKKVILQRHSEKSFHDNYTTSLFKGLVLSL